MATCMSRGSSSLQLLRICLHGARLSSSVAAGVQDTKAREQSDSLRHQFFLSGVRFLKNDPDKLKSNLKKRRITLDVDRMLQVYQDYRQLLHKIELLRKQRNDIADLVATTKVVDERERLIKQGSEIKHLIQQSEVEHKEKETVLMEEVMHIPNAAHDDVPIGGEEQARVVSVHGSKPEFSFPVQDHTQIGEHLGLFNFQAASHASGPSYYYLTGAAAMLEIGLIQYAMQKAVSKGFHPVITPDVVKDTVVIGCGFQPRGEGTHVYQLDSAVHGSVCLSGTAEVPLAGLLMNSVTDLKKLPMKMVAFGRCFRAEAGSRGSETSGLYRVHQFSKVEMFGVTANETGAESQDLLEEILDIQKEINTELGFHYRVLDMPTEELGAPAYRKYDIEVWMPGRGCYGEVTSASNCTDYQSYRLNAMYPNPAKLTNPRAPGRKPVHTVNGTCCAVPRVILALLETHQQEDGSVVVPRVLQPFVGNKTVLEA